MWTRTDPVPAEVRSIKSTQNRHCRLLLHTQWELAFRAEALALKSGLSFADIPTIPHGCFNFFRPPLNGHDGCITREYDLGTGPPLPKLDTIALLGLVIVFAVKLEKWSMNLHTECAVVSSPLLRLDATRSGLGFWFWKKLDKWVWTEQLLVVVEKWSRVAEREEELDAWATEAAAWVERLKEATGVVGDSVAGNA